MKLDVTNLRYLESDDWRVLSAVEMGMKNHELVPASLIAGIATVKHGGVNKTLQTLLRYKLVSHDRKQYDGYALTYAGYDYLALRTLVARGTIVSVGSRLGVGKESDIFFVADESGQQLVLKLHRLGRISFRAVKQKRDYLRHRRNASWLYMSRLAALKEFSFMKALHSAGFPTPTPIDCNRHCIVMSLANGFPLRTVTSIKHPAKVCADLMALIVRLARCGLIHCDFNEFNLMISPDEKVTIIDFPQMVSTSHRNAKMYFDRDVQCIVTYFERKHRFICEDAPTFAAVGDRMESLDVTVEASGFTSEQQQAFEDLMDTRQRGQVVADGEGEGEGEDDSDEDAFEGAEETKGAAGDADVDDATEGAAAGAGAGAGSGAGAGAADTSAEAGDGADAPTSGGGVRFAGVAGGDGSDDDGAAGGGEEHLAGGAGEWDNDAAPDEAEDSDDPGVKQYYPEGSARDIIMEASEPIPRIMRRRAGSRFRQREPANKGNNAASRVRQQLRAKNKKGKSRGAARNTVKNREKARLRRETREY